MEPPAFIEGRVLNGETGEPVAGVLVEARGVKKMAWPQAVTDSQGRYRLESLSANEYVIWAVKEGWTVRGIDGFKLNVGETKTVPDLRLIRGELIVGKVINADTNRPIRPRQDKQLASEFARPEVWLTSGPSRPAFHAAYQLTPVEEDGTFQVRVAPGVNWICLRMPETWEVVTSPPGTLQKDTHQVNVVEGKQAEVEFRVRRKAAAIREAGAVLPMSPAGPPRLQTKVAARVSDSTALGPPGAKAASKGAATERKEPKTTKRMIPVRVVGPDGKPIAGAKVHSSAVAMKRREIVNRNYVTDADGRAGVEVPQAVDLLRIWRKNGLAPMFAHWEQSWFADGRRLLTKLPSHSRKARRLAASSRMRRDSRSRARKLAYRDPQTS